MSVILLAGRKKAITQKNKKIIRKAGCASDGFTLGEETGSWRVLLNNKEVIICFSRDTMNVMVDGVCVDAMAYVTDEGYDLDLLFEVDGYRGHIYSDVEGTEMTNYLFCDDKLLGKQSMKNCSSKHKPGKGKSEGKS
ncbi:uncharacterized protein [Littorina saxatilis]|uniref:Uncharacterized protein n=1 Tax=Littorina saxatilis TaxID=31220 RepID=A0AAN9G0V8_9CAEN